MNSELGSSRRTVATVFHMGWTPPSERQLLIPCDRGVWLGKKEGNAA